MTITLHNEHGHQIEVATLPTGKLAILTPCCNLLAFSHETAHGNMARCSQCGDLYGFDMAHRYDSLTDLTSNGWNETAPTEGAAPC